jgi:hypothetical protein
MCVYKKHAFIYFGRPPSWSGTFFLQQTNGSCRYLLVPFSIYKYVLKWQHIYMYIHTHRKQNYIYIFAAISKGKQKPRQFSLFCLPFAHCELGSFSFVRSLTKKKLSLCKRTCPSTVCWLTSKGAAICGINIMRNPLRHYRPHPPREMRQWDELTSLILVDCLNKNVKKRKRKE